MFKAWAHSDVDRDSLVKELEHHLNEHAEEVISVSFAVSGGFHVLAVYREVESGLEGAAEAAVDVAEEIIEQAQA